MSKENNNTQKEEGTKLEEEFMDIQTGAVMSRSEMIMRIEQGQYPGYYAGASLKDPLPQR